MQPYFTHDCTRCAFLGQTVAYQGEGPPVAYDLYFCIQAGGIPTVVARYGDDGPDYTSGLGRWIMHPALVEAAMIATERGFIT